MIIQKKKNLKSVEEDFLLPEKELVKAQKKYSDPDYSGGSLVLDESASVLDKTKYEVCQIILTYKQKNDLSIAEIAQQVSLSKTRTEDILHCQIDKFTLDKLVAYAERLLPALRMKLVAPNKSSVSRRPVLYK